MMKSSLFTALLLLCLKAAYGQDDFNIKGIVPQRSSPPVLDVSYTGKLPADTTVLLDGANWRVWVTKPGQTDPTELEVKGKLTLVPFTDFDPHKLRITMSGDLPEGDDIVESSWHALFAPPKAAKTLAQTWDFTPVLVVKNLPASTTAAAKKPSCDNKPPDPKPYFCAPASGTPADISISGSFIAGGGTKPIYTFELIGGLYKIEPVKQLFQFHPGISTAIEVNQNKQPPNDRTTFDPDSITAALAFQRLVPVNKGALYGVQLDEALPGGEFSRTDPSSNIIFRSSALFALKSLSKRDFPAYARVYPLLAIEGGTNLNKPTMLAKTPVDLSHYDGIFRGLVGADAFFGVISKKDKSSDVFSISATYRVRLPAFDEPLVKTLHQVTTVQLTTKARNWIEADVNYSPWSFKFLSLTAKYQYGELPPTFTLVDHLFSFGLTFKANQSGKSHFIAAEQ